LEIWFHKIFALLASNYNPPDLSLPNS
jgi:hypothetical protein